MGFAIDNSATVLPAQTGGAEGVHPIVRVLPSLTDIVVILTLIFLFAVMGGTNSLLGDGDTGWHLRTGQWILANGRVPHVDIFSYSMPGRPWFAWEWLWDVAFAIIFNAFGLGGVVLGTIVVLCCTTALLFRLVLHKCSNVLIAFVVTSLAVVGSSLHWLARPHMFTLLFGVIFLHILERVKDAFAAGDAGRGVRWLWTLPVLSVLWTNVHGGFLLGIILTGCYGAGELVSALLVSGTGRGSALGRAWRYLLAAAGCLLASVINPYAFGLHRHLIEYFQDRYAFDHIGEFQSVSFHGPISWTLEVMILLGALGAFRECKRREFVYVFLFAGWAHLGLLSGRNIPIFMLVAAPLVAALLHELVESLRLADVARWLRRAAASFERTAADIGETDGIGRIHLVSVAAVAVVAALIYAPAPPAKFRAEYDPKKYPAKALEFLGGAGIQNRIFTDDEWGDYLVFRLYPTKVFVDGRSDFYGQEFCERYLDVLDVKYSWQKTLDSYAVDTILLSTKAPLSGALKESHNWRVVYDDSVAVVFRRAAAPARSGVQNSAVHYDGGTGRDRKITKSQSRDQWITKITT